MIIYKKTGEWYSEKRVTKSGTTSANECQRVVISSKFRVKEEPEPKHPKEDPLNLLEEDLEEDLLNQEQI